MITSTTTFDQFLLYSIEKRSFESCLTNCGHILETAGYHSNIVTCSKLLNFSFKDFYPPDKIFLHAYFNVAEVLIQ